MGERDSHPRSARTGFADRAALLFSSSSAVLPLSTGREELRREEHLYIERGAGKGPASRTRARRSRNPKTAGMASGEGGDPSELVPEKMSKAPKPPSEYSFSRLPFSCYEIMPQHFFLGFRFYLTFSFVSDYASSSRSIMQSTLILCLIMLPHMISAADSTPLPASIAGAFPFLCNFVIF